MQKITPMLWFDGNAEIAMNLYLSIFRNARINKQARYPEGAPGLAGSLMTASITIEGQDFTLLNGGPQFRFNEAVSFIINCESQEEVDYYWESLTANGGNESQCGWLKDPFGVSWQVVPSRLPQLLSSPDPNTAQRVMQAMLKMKKIDMAELEKAAGSNV